jgi:hypothetical protein
LFAFTFWRSTTKSKNSNLHFLVISISIVLFVSWFQYFFAIFIVQKSIKMLKDNCSSKSSNGNFSSFKLGVN